MDEATSSIDTDTERRIQAGLRRVLAGRTRVVIARRGRYFELYTARSLRDPVREETAWGGGDPSGVAPAGVSG